MKTWLKNKLKEFFREPTPEECKEAFKPFFDAEIMRIRQENRRAVDNIKQALREWWQEQNPPANGDFLEIDRVCRKAAGLDKEPATGTPAAPQP